MPIIDLHGTPTASHAVLIEPHADRLRVAAVTTAPTTGAGIGPCAPAGTMACLIYSFLRALPVEASNNIFTEGETA